MQCKVQNTNGFFTEEEEWFYYRIRMALIQNENGFDTK